MPRGVRRNSCRVNFWMRGLFVRILRPDPVSLGDVRSFGIRVQNYFSAVVLAIAADGIELEPPVSRPVIFQWLVTGYFGRDVGEILRT